MSCHGNKVEHLHIVENLQCPLGIRLYSSFSLMRQIIFFSWSLLMCTWHSFRTARQYSICVLSSCLGDRANWVSDNHLDKEEKTTHNTMGLFSHSFFICWLFSVELPGMGFFGWMIHLWVHLLKDILLLGISKDEGIFMVYFYGDACWLSRTGTLSAAEVSCWLLNVNAHFRPWCSQGESSLEICTRIYRQRYVISSFLLHFGLFCNGYRNKTTVL